MAEFLHVYDLSRVRTASAAHAITAAPPTAISMLMTSPSNNAAHTIDRTGWTS